MILYRMTMMLKDHHFWPRRELWPHPHHFQEKINKDNAWNLQLIDFMTSMLRRHDARMENLQTASTVVDASTRIYSFRVDAVHYDVLKMAGGLIKATQSKRGKKDDDAVEDEGGEEGNAAATKKKKKRSKGAIATNPDTLNDPFFERLAATTGDVNSSNRAFNATLSEGEEWANEDGLAAGGLHDQLGEMLEPPTKIAKIFIPYAMRAKKVDMKQLKHCSWKMLTENTPSGEKEDVKSTTFFSVYKRLPSKLSSNMADTLSVPLALLSVLHLANEKGLILQKQDDLKDFSIKGLIKES
ncbi:unnamed protein product [Leptidea sinapis]|uniref:Condensin complex subunit 2 n=1 Tax=Leptidea sinapis TaxID=189913 RepID=A0A5E4QZ63_9NEOP|nr:unnamed protein product [Leptidea sinapis]